MLGQPGFMGDSMCQQDRRDDLETQRRKWAEIVSLARDLTRLCGHHDAMRIAELASYQAHRMVLRIAQLESATETEGDA
jgi:hypothetical protein